MASSSSNPQRPTAHEDDTIQDLPTKPSSLVSVASIEIRDETEVWQGDDGVFGPAYDNHHGQPIASSSSNSHSPATSHEDNALDDSPTRASSPASVASNASTVILIEDSAGHWEREEKHYRKDGVKVKDYAFDPVYTFPQNDEPSTSEEDHYGDRKPAQEENVVSFEPYAALAQHEYYLSHGSADLLRIDLHRIDPVFYHLVTDQLTGGNAAALNVVCRKGSSDANDKSSKETTAKAELAPATRRSRRKASVVGGSGGKTSAVPAKPSKDHDEEPPNEPSGHGSSQKAFSSDPDAVKLVEVLKRCFPSAWLDPRAKAAILVKEEVKAILQPYLDGCLEWWARPAEPVVKGKGKRKAEMVPRQPGLLQLEELEEKLKEYELPIHGHRDGRDRAIKERNEARRSIVELRMKAKKILEQVQDEMKTKKSKSKKAKAKATNEKADEIPHGLALQKTGVSNEQREINLVKDKVLETIIPSKKLDINRIKTTITDVLVENLEKEDANRIKEDGYKPRKTWIEEMLGDPEGELYRFIEYEVMRKNTRPLTRPTMRDIVPADLFIESVTTEENDLLYKDHSFTFTPLSLFFTFILRPLRAAPLLGPVTSTLLAIGWISAEDQKRWLPVDLKALAYYKKSQRGGGTPFTICNPEGKGWEEVLGRGTRRNAGEDGQAMDVDEEFVDTEKGKGKGKSRYPLPPTREERKHMLEHFLKYGSNMEPEYYQIQKLFTTQSAPWDEPKASDSNGVPNPSMEVDTPGPSLKGGAETFQQERAPSTPMDIDDTPGPSPKPDAGKSSTRGCSAKNKRKADEEPATSVEGTSRTTKKRRTLVNAFPTRITRERVRLYAKATGLSVDDALERNAEPAKYVHSPSPSPIPCPARAPVSSQPGAGPSRPRGPAPPSTSAQDPVSRQPEASPSGPRTPTPTPTPPATPATPARDVDEQPRSRTPRTLGALGRQTTMFF